MSDSRLNLDEWVAKMTQATSLAELDAIELELFGRKQGLLTAELRTLGAMSPDERKIRGEELNMLKKRLEDILVMRRQEMGQEAGGKLAQTEKIDVTLELPARDRGSLHPVPQFIKHMEDVFGRMGFDVAHGTEVEHEDFNFTLMNIPETHPARDMQDTLWVAGGSGHDVMRTHTSPVQMRYMRSHTPPFRMICPGTVYRKDYDATHSPMFHQCEGLMVGPDVSLAEMKGVMIAAMHELLFPEIEFRFRTSYFPFVEPGLEVDIRMRNTDGTPGRWLEVVGCGMVHPEVLKNGGIDPTKFQGFAFGFGIERLIMIKHGIKDLRAFYDSDLRFLKQFA